MNDRLFHACKKHHIKESILLFNLFPLIFNITKTKTSIDIQSF